MFQLIKKGKYHKSPLRLCKIPQSFPQFIIILMTNNLIFKTLIISLKYAPNNEQITNKSHNNLAKYRFYFRDF